MKIPLTLTLSACGLLAACSNGSNSGGGGAPGADLGINAGNAVTVARVSYAAALSAGAVGELSSGTGLLASGPSGISKIDNSFAVASKTGGATAQIPIPPTVENCLLGTITFSGEIDDPFTPTLTPGDFFDLVFDMCDDGVTVTDGALHYDVDAFTGVFASGLYEVTMTATLDTFQVETDSDVLTSNGDATVRLDTRLGLAVEAEVSGNSLTIDANTSSETQTDFSTLQTVDAGLAGSPYTMISSATLDSTQISGVVTYSTTTTFLGFGSDYPHTGVLLIDGENSSVRLTAIDDVNVTIEIDDNGDGTFDAPINMTWAELTGAT